MENRMSDFVLFVIIAYGYTWLSGLLAIQIGLSLDIVQIVAALGPLIAAVIVTFRLGGKKGIRDFFSRAYRWRFNPIWYVIALLVPFTVFAMRFLLAIYIGGAAAPTIWFSLDSAAIAFLIFTLVMNGIGEETGWRGFALPQLQQRFGSLAASIILGVIWALWHLPLFFIPGSYQYGESLFEYILWAVSLTIIMAMLCNKAEGSVLVAIILHEAQNFIAFTMTSPSGSGVYSILLFLMFALLSIPFLPRPLVTEVVLPKTGAEVCPHCGARLRFTDEELRSGTVKCQNCQKPIDLPENQTKA